MTRYGKQKMAHPTPPLPTEADSLIRLVRGIVLAQGNNFIKELLRDRGIKIGATKADFEANMTAAILAGELQRQHIEGWLAEVEGWGDQHAYIYKIPRELCANLRDDTEVHRKVIRAGFRDQWNADTSLEYPTERTLTRIHMEDGQLSFIWHQGKEFAIRRKDLDYREERDGDTYEFRAYRIRAERSVTRFIARPADALAAIFIQAAWDEDEHSAIVEDIYNVVRRVLPVDDLAQIAIASAIKNLDTQALDSRDVIANSTRLSSGGAYVEFASTSARLGYQDVGPVREVRRAVRPRNFAGLNGNFMLPCADKDGKTRSVRVQLYGEQRRLRLAYQMTASEVWSVISIVKENV